VNWEKKSSASVEAVNASVEQLAKADSKWKEILAADTQTREAGIKLKEKEFEREQERKDKLLEQDLKGKKQEQEARERREKREEEIRELELALTIGKILFSPL